MTWQALKCQNISRGSWSDLSASQANLSLSDQQWWRFILLILLHGFLWTAVGSVRGLRFILTHLSPLSNFKLIIRAACKIRLQSLLSVSSGLNKLSPFFQLWGFPGSLSKSSTRLFSDEAKYFYRRINSQTSLDSLVSDWTEEDNLLVLSVQDFLPTDLSPSSEML